MIDFQKIKVSNINGRYIYNETLRAFLKAVPESNPFKEIGQSVQKKPIYELTIGSGPKRVLMWSQMHGNESTTTKAVLDLINLLNEDNHNDILRKVTLRILPILNPDGAEAYTRVNANGVDLNRDAQKLTQPESKVLRKVFKSFRPHYCFNLHDQRTIFNVGEQQKPATISFLAPAFDNDRNLSPSREKAMKVIVAMNQVLQNHIPGQVGRFDDSFNPNCVGDAFQMEKVPTILFEAGHYKGDYQREKTREFIFYSLLTAIETIGEDKTEKYALSEYLEIPENKKLYVDILIQNAHILDEAYELSSCIGILYKEVLRQGKIIFIPWIAEKGFKPNSFFGHKVVDCLKEDDLKWLRENRILELTK